MGFFDIYDKDGTPLSEQEFFGKRTSEYKRVAETTLDDGTWVSTVWLGHNHNFGSGAPVIFETMVFGEGSPHDQEQERYTTMEEALEGHRQMVSRCLIDEKATNDPGPDEANS